MDDDQKNYEIWLSWSWCQWNYNYDVNDCEAHGTGWYHFRLLILLPGCRFRFRLPDVNKKIGSTPVSMLVRLRKIPFTSFISFTIYFFYIVLCIYTYIHISTYIHIYIYIYDQTKAEMKTCVTGKTYKMMLSTQTKSIGTYHITKQVRKTCVTDETWSMLDTVKTYKMMLATQTKSMGAQKKTRVAGRSLIQHSPDLPLQWLSWIKVAELYDANNRWPTKRYNSLCTTMVINFIRHLCICICICNCINI